MEVEDITLIILCFAFLFLLACNGSNMNRITELENKINGNCMHVNNEFYCKD